MKEPLLYAKLKIPQPRSHYLPRPNLYQRMDEMLIHKILLVQGGAGCGKTTLITSYLKERAISSCMWISLDASCNQMYVFWEYMIAAFQRHFQKEDFTNFYHDGLQKENIQHRIILLLNQLEMIKESIYLVLDDVQNIQDQEVLKSFHFFLHHAPDHLHVILLSRTIPALYLSDFLLANTLCILEEEQLKFTREEELSFLRETMHLTFSHEVLQHMCEMAQGWIAGLQLIAVASETKQEDELLHHRFSSQLLDEYITKEIYNELDEAQQEFLCVTSIMNYFTTAMLPKILPNEITSAHFATFIKQNFLIITVDEEQGMYRLHDILKQYLQQRFAQYPKEQQMNYRTSIAQIYYEHQDFGECLYQYFLLEDYESAMRVLLEMKPTGEMVSYLLQVPLSEISKNPDFAYQYFFYHYTNFDSERCEQIYRILSQELKNEETFQAFRFSDKFLYADFYNGDMKILPLETILALPLSEGTISFLLIKDAFFLYVQNRYEEAFRYLERVKELYRKTKNPYTGFILFLTLTQMYEEMGEMKLALSIYEIQKPLMSELPSMSSSYYLGIAGLYLKQMKLKECADALTQCAKYLQVEHGSFIDSIHRGYIQTKALYDVVCGDRKDGLLQLEGIVHRLKADEYVQFALLFQFYFCFHDDKHWKQLYRKRYEASNTSLLLYPHHFLYASLLYETRKEAKALLIVNLQLQRARKSGNLYSIVEGCLLKVSFLYKEKEAQRQCVDACLEAIAYAYPNEIRLPFWRYQKQLYPFYKGHEKELLERLNKEETSFFKALIDVQTYDLTKREEDVLEELVTGKKNQEIADCLCISIATVKTHILNIYGKLQVNSRAEIVNWYHEHKG